MEGIQLDPSLAMLEGQLERSRGGGTREDQREGVRRAGEGRGVD